MLAQHLGDIADPHELVGAQEAVPLGFRHLHGGNVQGGDVAHVDYRKAEPGASGKIAFEQAADELGRTTEIGFQDRTQHE